MTISLPSIESTYGGFLQLTRLASETGALAWDTLDVDLGSATWIDANMCAPLGAILYKVSREMNEVRVTNVPPRVKTILAKNGFLSNYGEARRPDTYGTTIEYTRFEQKDDRYFGSYIEEHLKGKGIPRMTPALTKKFMESIFEVFSNAVIHSETKLGIFGCGQYFPKAHRVDFSVADLGLGIRENLARKRGITLDAVEAIQWALSGSNTTKTGDIPGGLGLKLLREFIQLNQGRIQIVSDDGYWELAAGRETTLTLPHPFPGTVVNIEINTADTNAYRLSTEIDPSEIF